jgi:IMP dehydrogenase
VGILTSRDYSMEEDETKKVSDLMTSKKNLITAESNISLEKARFILHKNRIEKLPLLEDGELRGLITRRDIRRLDQSPNAVRDKKGRLLVGAAVGVKDALERSAELVKAGVDVIVLDIAHCHSDFAIKKIKELKSTFKIDVMAGNIATKTAAEDLIKAGADGLKVGIGPSPVCTTRLMSGSGIPQLTAILDVCSVAKKYGVPVSADGGAKYPGDVAKAIAAGADTIYSGSFFAGTSETPGLIIALEGKRYKRYMGSASYDNNHERKEKLEGKKHKEKINVFVEGVSTLVDYKGSVRGIISSLVNGLRSGVSYCGAHNLKEMQENAEFIKVTSSGIIESRARGKKLSE